jgi:hypothetical protein
MADDSDDAVLAAACDDPTIVRALITLCRTNELAMRAVRWALAFHVPCWHRLLHGDEAQAIPEKAPQDVVAFLKEALDASVRATRDQ